MQHIRNNWLGLIFFSPGNTHTNGLLLLIQPSFEGVTDVDTDSKRRFVSFKVTPSNERVLSVYADSGHNTVEQLSRGISLKDFKIIWKMKVRDKNKINLGDFNCTMD